jgi:hypothetical protein
MESSFHLLCRPVEKRLSHIGGVLHHVDATREVQAGVGGAEGVEAAPSGAASSWTTLKKKSRVVCGISRFRATAMTLSGIS